MSWKRMLPAWFHADSPTITQAEDEIDEELMFHLQSLVDENLAEGMPFDAAWRDARKRFGSVTHHADACRRATLGRYFTWPRLAFGGLIALAAFVAWLALEVRALHSDQVALRSDQAALRDARSHAEDRTLWSDLAGTVLARDGEPLAAANVLVILKTWPGGRYRQEAFATTSDAQGRFRLPHISPPEGQYAVQVAALKDGYALTSSYQLEGEGRHPALEPLQLRLNQAAHITLVVCDDRGQRVANARVVPASRQAADGQSHLVYFQASDPVQIVSDSQGRVGLGCFEPGDQAEVYVRLPGRDWQRHAIRVPQDGDIVVVSPSEAIDDSGHDPPGVEQKAPS